jgi:hypothetical protein
MKKLISFVVIISLLFSQPAQAHFFTDLLGGLFTIVSYPIQLILGSTKSPFFVAQNPFVEKDWHKEERKKVLHIINEIPEAKPQSQPPEATPTPTPLKLKPQEKELTITREQLRQMQLRPGDMPIEVQQQADFAWRWFFGGNVQQEQEQAAFMWGIFQAVRLNWFGGNLQQNQLAAMAWNIFHAVPFIPFI